jgi:very-short-patch-repair endonuclease
MRREMTAPELKLWLELRAKRFSAVKFRRQVVLGHYIADFASRSRMLIIELDGETHAEREAYDGARTAALVRAGFRVLRFTNSNVMSNLDGVLHAIGEALQTPPLPNPLP